MMDREGPRSPFYNGSPSLGRAGMKFNRVKILTTQNPDGTESVKIQMESKDELRG